jgi:hypothetical protein
MNMTAAATSHAGHLNDLNIIATPSPTGGRP